MNDLLLINLILCLFFETAIALQIPSYVTLCKRNDPNFSECLTNSIDNIRPHLVGGIPEMDLPPGDPLEYLNVSASSGSDSVSLRGKSFNSVARGFMNFKIQYISLNVEEVKLKATLIFPSVRLQGDYEIKGKLLLFILDTNGVYDINATDVIVNCDANGKYHTKNSKQFMEFDQIILNIYNISSGNINMTNLISGNEQLTQVVNGVFNENINGVLLEIRGLMEDVYSRIVRLYFDAVFGSFPADELFPLD